MDKKYVLVNYESSISNLSAFLEKINPNDIIAITERYGYTIVYRSNSRYSWEYRK